MTNSIFIISNKIQCNSCKDILTSKHRYDFKMCSCKMSGVDGGNYYRRRIGSNFIEMSIYSNDDFEVIRNNLYRNGTTLLKDMSNGWLEACISYERMNRPINKLLKFYIKELEYRKQNKIFIKDNK